MFPKAVRLTDKRLFEAVFRKGTWVRGRFFSFVHIPARGQARIGFVITKKVTKSAVLRNRTKRRIRAALHEQFANPKYAHLFAQKNIVVVVHQSVADESYEVIQQQVERVLDKLLVSEGQ